MALRDHFHPPLLGRRHWHSFHNGWAYNLTEGLNLTLPRGYFAEANVQFGIEIDVATFEEDGGDTPTFAWHPPPPTKTIPFTVLTDVVEVNIYDNTAGPILVGAIEIVSPANKDRTTHRQAFVSKCKSLLQQGVGLLIVDIVTNRRANLHNELLIALNEAEAVWEAALYCAAYRPVANNGHSTLAMWQQSLQLGQQLPTMPLWLRGNLCLPVDLNTAYQRTSRAHRLDEVM